MSKSVATQASDFAQLIKLLGLTGKEVYSCNFYNYGSAGACHVSPEAFLKVHKKLSSPKVEFDHSGTGNLHIHMNAKGIRWTCVMLVEDVERFKLSIQREGIAQSRPRLPAPVLALEAKPST